MYMRIREHTPPHFSFSLRSRGNIAEVWERKVEQVFFSQVETKCFFACSLDGWNMGARE
jgi:hypothetical protein